MQALGSESVGRVLQELEGNPWWNQGWMIQPFARVAATSGTSRRDMYSPYLDNVALKILVVATVIDVETELVPRLLP